MIPDGRIDLWVSTGANGAGSAKVFGAKTRALAWVVEHYDAELPGGRSVPPEVDAHPHAGHWDRALHAPGGPWPHVLIPGARFLSRLEHWRELAPSDLIDSFHTACVAHARDLGGEVAATASTTPRRSTSRRCARACVSSRSRRSAATRAPGPTTRASRSSSPRERASSLRAFGRIEGL